MLTPSNFNKPVQYVPKLKRLTPKFGLLLLLVNDGITAEVAYP